MSLVIIEIKKVKNILLIIQLIQLQIKCKKLEQGNVNILIFIHIRLSEFLCSFNLAFK